MAGGGRGWRRGWKTEDHRKSTQNWTVPAPGPAASTGRYQSVALLPLTCVGVSTRQGHVVLLEHARLWIKKKKKKKMSNDIRFKSLDWKVNPPADCKFLPFVRLLRVIMLTYSEVAITGWLGEWMVS